MSSIFLSYAISDESFVFRLVNDLKVLGFTIYQDQIGTSTGQPFLERLISGMKPLDFILLICSQSSEQGTIAASDWKDAIIDEAIHGRNWLVPVLIEDSILPEYIFSDSIEDFRNPSEYSFSFQKLINRISTNG